MLINTKDIKTPLWIIAIAAASLISLIGAAILWELVNPNGQDIRITHLQQHHDEQVKFDRMIELLEEIEKNNDENSNYNEVTN